MIVVSDTSPIRALAFLEQLTVLDRLFGTVVIPPSVADELANPARLASGESPPDLSRFPFIEIRAPADDGRVGRAPAVIGHHRGGGFVVCGFDAKDSHAATFFEGAAFGRRRACSAFWWLCSAYSSCSGRPMS